MPRTVQCHNAFLVVYCHPPGFDMFEPLFFGAVAAETRVGVRSHDIPKAELRMRSCGIQSHCAVRGWNLQDQIVVPDLVADNPDVRIWPIKCLAQ
jgi:hypothetical protein